MALEKIYTANGSEDDFNIVFSYLEKQDVSVLVEPSGGSYELKTLDVHYTISGSVVTFKTDHIPPNNSKVKVRRSTLTEQPRFTYYAGSSITAASLNNNFKQILYALEEFKELNAATLQVDVGANSIGVGHMAINSIDSDQYVDGSIDTAHIADDQVTADKLANSINAEIAANTAKVTNATHTGEVTGATALTITDNVVDEANLKISNAGSDGDYLTKQSGNTGGLTWASLASNSGLVKQVVSSSLTNEVDMDNTMTDTGLSATITVTGTNKVLIIVQQSYRVEDTDGGYAWELRLMRNTTYEVLHRFMNHDATSSGNTNENWHTLINLHYPGAGSHTYKTQMKGGGNDCKAQPGGQRSDLILIELDV